MIGRATDDSSTENQTDTDRGCGYCERTFSNKRERAFHWFKLHCEVLSAEDERTAVQEDARRWGEHKVQPKLDVSFPAETWEYIVELYGPVGADPDDVEPSDVKTTRLVEMLDPLYHFEVERDEREEWHPWEDQ